MIDLLEKEGDNIPQEKREIIISTILKFSTYDVVKTYFLNVLAQSDTVYIKF